MSKFLAQDTRGVAFELGGQLGRCHTRITLHKHMYVIRHHFQGMQRDMQFGSLRSKQGFQAFRHRAKQHRLTIFRAENEVIFERKDRASVACIPVMFHAQNIVRCLVNNNYLTGERAADRNFLMLTEFVVIVSDLP